MARFDPVTATATTNSSTSFDYAAALYAFLDKLSPSMFSRLYEAPASCLSIFRLLPPTSRHIVLDIMWCSEPFTLADVEHWVRERKSDGGSAGEKKHLNSALSALARLNIMSLSGRSEKLVLHDRFRENFKMALTGGGAAGAFGVLSSKQDADVTVAFLDKHAEDKWESILHFMVGSDGVSKPSQRVLQLLVRGGLMSSSTSSLRDLNITSKGFQFLLEDVNTQLWDLLLEYLEQAEDTVQTLGFLFLLGSLELGKAYETAPLSSAERALVDELADYGLVYQTDDDAFYPTRLATTLTSSAPPLVSSQHADEERGFLIVETNYKIYAYTSNPLQIAVLNLFIALRSRFPNFVTGMITRDSIKRGLANGITADQIVHYLQTRAHPQMRKKESILPSTVVDQIRLWEQEGNRIQSTGGFLYDDFSSTSDFELVRDYARQLEVLVWELPAKRKLFVTEDGHAQVREFIKRKMAAAAAENGNE